MDKIVNITTAFAIEGTVNSITPLSIGHINSSYVVQTQENTAPNYLLQQINHHIFKDVDMLQNNIAAVTDHIRKKLQEQNETDIERKVLRIIPTRSGDLYHFDGEGYWRVYLFIEGARSYDAINPQLAYEAGKAFGNFQDYLADLPKPLGETIPDFHNMEFRLEQFKEALSEDKAKRVKDNQAIIEAIEKRAAEMCLPNQWHREGKLPKRTNHCDTKVNNVMFDKASNTVLAVVDLDTVMPGFVLSDFGDFMRTGANTGAEDDKDLSKVGIDLAIFEGYAQGYAQKAKNFLLPIEVNNLAFGAKLLTYMQTVRFFTDYLNGDTYYKIQHPEHNLQRTLAQLRLLEDMEAKFEQMQEIVAKAFA